MYEKSVSKKLNGQFFTITNPFISNPFYNWLDTIPISKKQKIVEPFAGSNNIVKMIDDLNIMDVKWYCYDIQPSIYNAVDYANVKKRDTIENFPKIKNCYIAITNPPYLAKNSATRSGLPYKYDEYDDLYKKCLEVMLNNCEYIAAIVPESFLTANLFHNRLYAVISLTCKMFDDTECPVCLALFSPEDEIDKENGFSIYKQGSISRVGTYNVLSKYVVKSTYNREKWIFNNPNGEVGIICCDNTKSASIKFVNGNEIKSEYVKVTSRAKTRVSGLPNNVNIVEFIARCNEVLNEYREKTQDVFLTSFKGLRDDNMYRRRLDFDTAKNIMSYVLEVMKND